jgi:hypothetical protein
VLDVDVVTGAAAVVVVLDAAGAVVVVELVVGQGPLRGIFDSGSSDEFRMRVADQLVTAGPRAVVVVVATVRGRRATTTGPLVSAVLDGTGVPMATTDPEPDATFGSIGPTVKVTESPGPSDAVDLLTGTVIDFDPSSPVSNDAWMVTVYDVPESFTSVTGTAVGPSGTAASSVKRKDCSAACPNAIGAKTAVSTKTMSATSTPPDARQPVATWRSAFQRGAVVGSRTQLGRPA